MQLSASMISKALLGNGAQTSTTRSRADVHLAAAELLLCPFLPPETVTHYVGYLSVGILSASRNITGWFKRAHFPSSVCRLIWFVVCAVQGSAVTARDWVEISKWTAWYCTSWDRVCQGRSFLRCWPITCWKASRLCAEAAVAMASCKFF